MEKKVYNFVYKSSECNSYFKDGKWYVSQYFSEGFKDKEDDEWEEADFAIDTEDEDYGVAVNKGMDAFLEALGEGTIVEYNRSNKELPENAIEEED